MLPDPIDREVQEYFSGLKIESARVQRADVILALLRLGHLDHAQELAGVQITRCPPFIPAWPPRPVSGQHREAVLVYVEKGKVYRLEMGERWKKVRVGMTRAQLLARGVTVRDLGYWLKDRSIKWSSNDAPQS